MARETEGINTVVNTRGSRVAIVLVPNRKNNPALTGRLSRACTIFFRKAHLSLARRSTTRDCLSKIAQERRNVSFWVLDRSGRGRNGTRRIAGAASCSGPLQPMQVGPLNRMLRLLGGTGGADMDMHENRYSKGVVCSHVRELKAGPIVPTRRATAPVASLETASILCYIHFTLLHLCVLSSSGIISLHLVNLSHTPHVPPSSGTTASS